MSSTAPSLVRIVGASKDYDWGKHGHHSAVWQLQRAGAHDESDHAKQLDAHAAPEAKKPYAELWMGTHPSGPAHVHHPNGSTKPLHEHLEMIGGEKHLPFLFKVLSVNKALSIQAHPDMDLAKQLHANDNTNYKDPHHKPELACALTPFEAMCAFRPIDQIRANATQYPEFAALMGEEALKKIREASTPEQTKEALQTMFRAMMTPSAEALKAQLASLLARFKAEGVVASVPACEQPRAELPSGVTSLDVPSLIVRLNAQYPGDVGVFAPFYLNAFVLQPGQAIFLGPNEPHAYLSGDCVECMACSDNVVRAGLTPKFRDTATLVDMLTYATHTPESALMTSRPSGDHAPHTHEFAPPSEFAEFRLLKTDLPASASSTLPVCHGASIVLVWSGAGQLALGDEKMDVAKGHVVLVPDQASVIVTTSQGLQLYQCAANKQ